MLYRDDNVTYTRAYRNMYVKVGAFIICFEIHVPSV